MVDVTSGDLFEMSDEDFLKLPPADHPGQASAEEQALANPELEADASLGSGEADAAKTGAETGQEEVVPSDDDLTPPAAKPEGTAADGGEGAGADGTKGAEAAPGAEGEGDAAKPGGEKPAEGGAAQPAAKEGEAPGGKAAEGAVPAKPGEGDGAKPKDGEKAPEGTDEPVNYAAIGEAIMRPIKASGGTLQVRNAEEAIKLMQMGAHFTRKMQAIQPHRKVLTMLENNGLLDEDRLSFLIDIEKKNPEAIKKLIKDAGIAPLEIDTSIEPAYQGGSHRVSDAEVNFRSAMEEVSSSDDGREFLQHSQTNWDDATKEAVWGDPSLLTTLYAQKQSGIYDRINSEIERRRTLGDIGPATPFLAAYQTVGSELQNSGAFNDLAPAPAPRPAEQKQHEVAPQPAPAPVATRAAAPKQGADNNDKVAAAAPSRSGSRPAKPIFNPLEISDEEFLALPVPK